MFTPAGGQRLFVCLYFAKPQSGCIAAISLDDEQNNRYNDYDDNDNDDDDHDHEDDDHDDENHEKRYIYEVDFIYDGMEYSYEIDAESKEILQRQYESWWN